MGWLLLSLAACLALSVLAAGSWWVMSLLGAFE